MEGEVRSSEFREHKDDFNTVQYREEDPANSVRRMRNVVGMESAVIASPGPSSSNVSYTNLKPPFSFIYMISQAIKSRADRQIPLDGIYNYISDRYPYYKHLPHNGWKSSIRHTLSSNDCFIKLTILSDNTRTAILSDNTRERVKCVWTLDPQSEGMFEDGGYSRRKKVFRRSGGIWRGPIWSCTSGSGFADSTMVRFSESSRSGSNNYQIGTQHFGRYVLGEDESRSVDERNGGRNLGSFVHRQGTQFTQRTFPEHSHRLPAPVATTLTGPEVPSEIPFHVSGSVLNRPADVSQSIASKRATCENSDTVSQEHPLYGFPLPLASSFNFGIRGDSTAMSGPLVRPGLETPPRLGVPCGTTCPWCRPDFNGWLDRGSGTNSASLSRLDSHVPSTPRFSKV